MARSGKKKPVSEIKKVKEKAGMERPEILSREYRLAREEIPAKDRAKELRANLVLQTTLALSNRSRWAEWMDVGAMRLCQALCLDPSFIGTFRALKPRGEFGYCLFDEQRGLSVFYQDTDLGTIMSDPVVRVGMAARWVRQVTKIVHSGDSLRAPGVYFSVDWVTEEDYLPYFPGAFFVIRVSYRGSGDLVYLATSLVKLQSSLARIAEKDGTFRPDREMVIASVSRPLMLSADRRANLHAIPSMPVGELQDLSSAGRFRIDNSVIVDAMARDARESLSYNGTQDIVDDFEKNGSHETFEAYNASLLKCAENHAASQGWRLDSGARMRIIRDIAVFLREVGACVPEGRQNLLHSIESDLYGSPLTVHYLEKVYSIFYWFYNSGGIARIGFDRLVREIRRIPRDQILRRSVQETVHDIATALRMVVGDALTKQNPRSVSRLTELAAGAYSHLKNYCSGKGYFEGKKPDVLELYVGYLELASFFNDLWAADLALEKRNPEAFIRTKISELGLARAEGKKICEKLGEKILSVVRKQAGV